MTQKHKLCALVSLAMVVLSLIPQIHLWIVRGRDWNGAYVSPQGDEPLYSAYVNALIDGRPRKNDPFGGRDDSPAAPLPESHFSIQFVPAYAIALTARAFSISASSAFIALLAASAFLSSLAVFWLLDNVLGNYRTAAAGTLFVLCAGWILGRHGLFNTFFDIGIPALHFLRRYQPAAAFPLFFGFQGFVWQAFHSETVKRRWFSTVLAGISLVLLIFSYLYLWTGAAAWLICISTLWLIFRPAERRRTITVLATTGVLMALTLIPYLQLLSRRAHTVDEQQLLVSTHSPDFFRLHELLGAVVLLLLFAYVRSGRIKWNQSQVLFAMSLALLPFLVFNQQILTGKALQPFHYEIFVVNYSTMLAVVISVWHVWKPASTRFLITFSTLSILLGLIAVMVPARLLFVRLAVLSDQKIPVLLRLKELSTQDGTTADLQAKREASTIVFSPSVSLIALLSTWTSQPTLLDMTGVDCRALTREERKKFFAMHLYYSKIDFEALRQALDGTLDRPLDELASVRTVTFGYERTSPALTSNFKPIRTDEVDRELQYYKTYMNLFSRDEALKRPLAYAVIPADGNFDFTNLDRWYERDAGERVGDYVLYRLKLRP